MLAALPLIIYSVMFYCFLLLQYSYNTTLFLVRLADLHLLSFSETKPSTNKIKQDVSDVQKFLFETLLKHYEKLLIKKKTRQCFMGLCYIFLTFVKMTSFLPVTLDKSASAFDV